MDNTESELALERVSVPARVPPGSLGTDENLAVLKRDYVGRPGFIHESPMYGRDPPI